MTSREFIQQKAAVMSRALEELSPTYGGENPIGEDCALPSGTEVLRVLALLDDIFYPGYRSSWHPTDPVETLVIERLDEAYDILYRQVKRALPLRLVGKYAPSGKGNTCPVIEDSKLTAEAERVVGAFFRRLPHIREMLKRDVLAAYKGDPA